jgi:peptidyl-prolyl cis-trans isomerase B (cyclophilin B)
LLDRTTAPITVDNFVKLANEGFYNGLTIHRVKADFVIQGGCTKGDGTGGSSTTIKGEFSSNKYYGNDLSHIRGVISMARSGASMDSASSQFFICNADATNLDGAYAAFGYVINGMSIVDAITTNCAKYATGNSNSIPDKSKQPVIEYVIVVD